MENMQRCFVCRLKSIWNKRIGSVNSFANLCYLNNKEILMCPHVESDLRINDILSEKLNIEIDNKCYNVKFFIFAWEIVVGR